MSVNTEGMQFQGHFFCAQVYPSCVAETTALKILVLPQEAHFF